MSMSDLKPTQIEVLKVLAKFPDMRMGASDIEKYCSVNRGLISNAVNVLAKKDLVYQPDIYGKVQISGDGLSEAHEHS